jgi:hypothetical protein
MHGIAKLVKWIFPLLVLFTIGSTVFTGPLLVSMASPMHIQASIPLQQQEQQLLNRLHDAFMSDAAYLVLKPTLTLVVSKEQTIIYGIKHSKNSFAQEIVTSKAKKSLQDAYKWEADDVNLLSQDILKNSPTRHIATPLTAADKKLLQTLAIQFEKTPNQTVDSMLTIALLSPRPANEPIMQKLLDFISYNLTVDSTHFFMPPVDEENYPRFLVDLQKARPLSFGALVAAHNLQNPGQKLADGYEWEKQELQTIDSFAVNAPNNEPFANTHDYQTFDTFVSKQLKTFDKSQLDYSFTEALLYCDLICSWSS